MKKPMAHICSFDTELREGATELVFPKKMSKNEKDIELLKVSNRISIFWITETDRRARLIYSLERSGKLKLDNSCGYPWMIVKEFTP